ncbi:MAG: leucine-rich repeat domain-containing protein [Candidatus Nomurabacteria bacterium]|jgi:hypothetical protein|nr:leucine-rich repeat domain-containing protein [Candidatus Nomurabacteria bacterium]
MQAFTRKNHTKKLSCVLKTGLAVVAMAVIGGTFVSFNSATHATDKDAQIVAYDGVLVYGASTYDQTKYAVLGCDDGTGQLSDTCPDEIDIPASYGREVIEIADHAFENKSGVGKLTTHDGLLYVGEKAFANSRFTEMNFASTVLTYGNEAFFQMGDYLGVALTINFANPNPAVDSFGNDIMGYTWDNPKKLVVNIPSGAWAAYINAHSNFLWSDLIANNFYTDATDVLILMGHRVWETSDGPLPDITLYRAGSPLSPQPSQSVVDGYIINLLGTFDDDTYQVYTGATYTGVDIVVSGGKSRSVRVNFAATLTLSPVASESEPLDFGTAMGKDYTVTPQKVTITNTSGFVTATNLTVECSTYDPVFCANITGNLGNLAPGASIDIEISPRPGLDYGNYGEPTIGITTVHATCDSCGGEYDDIWAAFEVGKSLKLVGQDGRLSSNLPPDYGIDYLLQLGSVSASETATTYKIKVYNYNSQLEDISYGCFYGGNWLSVNGVSCDVLSGAPATIYDVPAGGWQELTLEISSGLTPDFYIQGLNFSSNDSGNLVVPILYNVVGEYGVNITSDSAHPSFYWGSPYTFADEYVGYDPVELKLPLVITNIGTEAMGEMTLECNYGCENWDYPASKITSLDPNQSTTIYVSPKAGLAARNYEGEFYLKSDYWSAPVYQVLSFNVKPCGSDECLQLEINDSDDSEILLPTISEDYADGDGATKITLKNVGNRTIPNITLALSDSNFILSNTENCASLAAGASCQFTITPTSGLSSGDYTAELNVSFGNTQTKTRNILFKVTSKNLPPPNPEPKPPATGINSLAGSDFAQNIVPNLLVLLVVVIIGGSLAAVFAKQKN